jgi:hypothetical protein
MHYNEAHLPLPESLHRDLANSLMNIEQAALLSSVVDPDPQGSETF